MIEDGILVHWNHDLYRGLAALLAEWGLDPDVTDEERARRRALNEQAHDDAMKLQAGERLFRSPRYVFTSALFNYLIEDPEQLLHTLLCFGRHQRGDWGDVDEEDQDTNKRALLDGDRLLSAYTLPGGRKIWIITEWDRSVTTLLFPEDY
jgi:hypothetical protein